MTELYANAKNFYIDGKWVAPSTDTVLDVLNPATEEVITQIAMGTKEDADTAVAAAKAAFPSWSATSREERLSLLEKIVDVYKRRMGDLSATVTAEMGAPNALASKAQVPAGLGHLMTAIEVLKNYEFEQVKGTTVLLREPVGVCAMITPWNWPLNQIWCKVAPALATGCTMVLKPSEVAPLDAVIVAEILHEAGVPSGVFNLVHGDGPSVGSVLSAHPDIDMVSFTGSTRAGILVSKNAADTVKRVSLELGGKSANIVLPDADLEAAAQVAAGACFTNSGQSCNAPTRLLVHEDQHDELVELIKGATATYATGDPQTKGTVLGPLVSKTQFDRVQALIQAGLDEGAEAAVGGLGLPEGLDKGYFVRPTVFTGVTPDMRIAQEEIFGPVLSVIKYSSEEEAIQIANDSEYGLGGAVQSSDPARAFKVASKIRTGMVGLNGAGLDPTAPFGGYKKSGNGREWGEFGFDEFTEVKAVMGYQPA
ncbi:aldehyde dehydrogenase family protein [Pseudonocardia spinosispora]|uniref:aldehyde dehydrogenase family protein n=1 Tax=Pseudonocardia spinosispora TaxID=103441 RepID=UPI000402FB17|nr:aldehyde dehydrogenase family protein [Pseudonocardia spinosispora]